MKGIQESTLIKHFLLVGIEHSISNVMLGSNIVLAWNKYKAIPCLAHLSVKIFTAELQCRDKPLQGLSVSSAL